MKLKVSLLLAALAVAASCGGSRPRAAMSDGERLYLSRCTSCHRTYAPGEFTAEQWATEVAKMERLKKVTLTAGERSLLLGWLGAEAAGMPGTPAAPPAPGAAHGL